MEPSCRRQWLRRQTTEKSWPTLNGKDDAATLWICHFSRLILTYTQPINGWDFQCFTISRKEGSRREGCITEITDQSPRVKDISVQPSQHLAFHTTPAGDLLASCMHLLALLWARSIDQGLNVVICSLRIFTRKIYLHEMGEYEGRGCSRRQTDHASSSALQLTVCESGKGLGSLTLRALMTPASVKWSYCEHLAWPSRGHVAEA